MKKGLKIFERIFQIILIIIIIINVISIVSVKVLKNKYPKVFGYSYFSVISGSMEPTIKVGDEILVKITKNVKKDDVIVFQEGEGFITHRVIEAGSEKLITKGDANDSNDDPILKDVVVGKVICVIPFLGKVKYVITNVYFIISLIVTYLLYVFVFDKE